MTLVTAKTIAEQYSIPVQTVRYYAWKGIFPYHRIIGRIKFNPKEIEEIVRRGKSNNGHEKVW